jgi:hypothetical protein
MTEKNIFRLFTKSTFLMVSQKVEIQKNLSFRRKPESSYFDKFWTPAFAGVTFQETFSETISFRSLNFYSISPSRNQPLGIGFFHHEPGQPLKKSGASKK